MYGMVNRALEDLVLTHHGPEMWRRITAEAQVHVETFLSMQPYPDWLTYDLVAATSRVLQTPAAELLRTFGRHWIDFAATNGYGDFIGRAGTDLAVFVRGLDAMHARLALSFPELRPPSFRCVETSPGQLTLHYHSERQGLQPFVAGLLEGLGLRFGTPVTVALVQDRETGADHDVFHVRWTVR